MVGDYSTVCSKLAAHVCMRTSTANSPYDNVFESFGKKKVIDTDNLTEQCAKERRIIWTEKAKKIWISDRWSAHTVKHLLCAFQFGID